MTAYTITTNSAFNSVEVRFETKPSEAIRDALKSLRFRWHGVKKIWYGYKSEAETREAIEAVEEKPEEEMTFSVEPTEAYMGAVGFKGSNSGKFLYGAELAQAIRDAIKGDGIKGVTIAKESYSMGQSIYATVRATDDDFISLDEYIAKTSLYDFAPHGWVMDTDENNPNVRIEEAEMWDTEKKDRVHAELASRNLEQAKGNRVSVNHYCIDDYRYFTDAFKAKLRRVRLIVQSFNYSDSNSMVDYFDDHFYFSLYTKYANK